MSAVKPPSKKSIQHYAYFVNNHDRYELLANAEK